jgi:3-hydroxyisobutyrate dehydrogenase-like beta-hydroxyacid dehydrogenase
MEVGVIGLGAMGGAMARNLAAAGHRVKAWNRSGGTIKGVTMVSSPVDALQGDAALTMLSEDAAIRAVLLQPGVLDHAKAGLVHILASTISVAFAKHLVGLHAKSGIAAPGTRGGRTGRPHSANARCGTSPHD